MAGVAEFPKLIKDIFLTEKKYRVGISAVKLFIRGKPWVIDVDDKLLFNN